MSHKFRHYSVIGAIAAATIVAIAVIRPAYGERFKIAQSGHARTSQTNDSEHSAMPGMSHESHKKQGASTENAISTQARLQTSGNFVINQPKKLTITVQDSQGKAITRFDRFQEQLMHLIVVSNDLQVFQHLHPTYSGNGRFDVEISLPQAGTYTLISDYKPAGKAEAVSLMQARIPGVPPTETKIDLQRSATIDATKVELSLSTPTIQAGKEVTITFDLKDLTGKPIQNLKPYLGEQGHLVILRQSTTLTKLDYVHAHAIKGTPAGRAEFVTTFPQSGKYKMWGQFNRDGKVVVAPFWVDVQ